MDGEKGREGVCECVRELRSLYFAVALDRGWVKCCPFRPPEAPGEAPKRNGPFNKGVGAKGLQR